MKNVTATLVSFTPDYLEVIAGAMSKCYEKTVGTKGVLKAVEAGHLSILEHAYATVDITCSLGVLGQLTRHRHFSPTVKSTRGADFKGDYIIPVRIENSKFLDEYIDFVLGAFRLYTKMIDAGIPHEDAAYVLPKATMTKLRLTGNFRAWFEYLPKRLCKRAMPEHRELAQLIHSELSFHIPLFDKDFLNCGNCTEHGCSFH